MYGEMTNFTHIWKPLMDERKDVEGVIVEFGCYAGGSAKHLASLNRHVYAFDTFTGMPTEGYDPNLDKENPPGKFHPGRTAEAIFEGFPNITPVVGEFQHTIPTMPSDLKVVLAYLDADWYSSMHLALSWLLDAKHLSPKGIITFHDYGCCPGTKKAVDEFVEKYKLTLKVADCSILDPAGSLYQ
jgi:hypothetical protein